MILPGILASGISGHLIPPSSYESIATVSVGSGGSSTITFSSIPATFTHLQIRVMGRQTNGSADNYANLRFNGDGGSNYSYHHLVGDGSTAAASSATSQTVIYLQRYAAAGAAASIFGASVIDILDYQNTNKNKTIRNLGGNDRNGAGAIYFSSGAWFNTAAVTSITITPASNDWAEYSSFALYGIKGA